MKQEWEEAAKEYEKEHTYQRYDGGGLTPEYDTTLAEAFIAGAEWHDRSLNWIRDLVKAGIEKPEEAVDILKRIDVLLNQKD